MKTRIADCVAIVSTALLIFLLADWYFSYHHSKAILLSGPAGKPIIITTGRGLIYIAAVNVPVVNSLPWSCDLRSVTPEELEDRFRDAAEASALHLGYTMVPVAPSMASPAVTTAERNAHGFALIVGKRISDIPGTFYALASIPFWAVIPPLGWISFAWSKQKLRTRAWRRQGRCRECGYDLRASPQRCPECGVEIDSDFRHLVGLFRRLLDERPL